MNKDQNKIDIYAKGIVAMSVCVPNKMSVKEVELQANAENPTGIDSRWRVSKDRFADGQPNPHMCEDHQYRSHVLLNC